MEDLSVSTRLFLFVLSSTWYKLVGRCQDLLLPEELLAHLDAILRSRILLEGIEVDLCCSDPVHSSPSLIHSRPSQHKPRSLWRSVSTVHWLATAMSIRSTWTKSC
jgi:hypothetical protein